MKWEHMRCKQVENNSKHDIGNKPKIQQNQEKKKNYQHKNRTQYLWYWLWPERRTWRANNINLNCLKLYVRMNCAQCVHIQISKERLAFLTIFNRITMRIYWDRWDFIPHSELVFYASTFKRYCWLCLYTAIITTKPPNYTL